VSLSLSLIIPSINRPESLARALQAVRDRATIVQQVIVVARPEDVETHDVAERFGAQIAEVSDPGLAAAMRAGAEMSRSDVVAFTDDDAAIRDGWDVRLMELYTSALAVGGVGGRDIVDSPDQVSPPKLQSAVGKVTAWGQVVGAHHLAKGKVREVDHLKGVNCSFLRVPFLSVQFQPLIMGKGAQARNEFLPSLAIRQMGLKLLFDPELIVDHYPAVRMGNDQRGGDPAKMYEAAYNERLGFQLFLRPKRFRNAFYLALIGYRHAPGILRLARGASVKDVRAVLAAIRDTRNISPTSIERVTVDHRPRT
jgi:glycosyltransferase involved in cell wall biosynthesis